MQGLIIGIVILVVLGGALWLAQRRQKISETALAQLAQSEGWQFQKSYELSHPGSGSVLRYRFSQADEDGAGWTLDIETASAAGGAGGTSVQNTIWRSDDVKLPEGLVLIGPRPKNLPANLDLGGMLSQAALQMLLQAALGNDAPDTVRLREVKHDSPGVVRHYLVFATDHDLPRRLLTAEAESGLLVLAHGLKEKQRPAVVFWKQGLQVRCAGLITDTPNLQRIAALGDALKSAWSKK